MVEERIMRRIMFTVKRKANHNPALYSKYHSPKRILFFYPFHFFSKLPNPISLCYRAMVSGVAAAVVVPVLLTLQQEGYGTAKGLPSLVLAVAALDDVLAVVGYAISASIVYGEDPLRSTTEP
jgi:hypothetical protein